MTIPETQKAWIYKEYGPKENVSISEDVIVSPAAPNEVLVKVHAASLNPFDVLRRFGVIGKIGGQDSPLPTVPGYDVAGEVVLVGKDVTKFKVGDRVYGDPHENTMFPKPYGPLAEYTPVEEKVLALIPERLSYAEAASLPVALETAYQSLKEAADLKQGETVLILGAAGGVGTLAIQLAKHVFKASVVAATASTSKVELLKGLGADIVIDYKTEKLSEHPEKYDVVLDFVGQGEALVAVKEPGGRAVVFNGQGTPPILNFFVTSKGVDLETLSPSLQDGAIKPVLDPKGQFKFSELGEAWSYLESGRASGKIVVSIID